MLLSGDRMHLALLEELSWDLGIHSSLFYQWVPTRESLSSCMIMSCGKWPKQEGWECRWQKWGSSGGFLTNPGEPQNQAAASLNREEPVDMVSSIRHIPQTLGQIQEPLEILYLTVCLGLSGLPKRSWNLWPGIKSGLIQIDQSKIPSWNQKCFFHCITVKTFSGIYIFKRFPAAYLFSSWKVI